MKKENIFKPFEDWSEDGQIVYGLCIKDGKIFIPPNGYQKYREYEVWKIFFDKVLKMWYFEFSNYDTSCNEVYFGKIETREFFVELMKNVYGGFDVEALETKK